MNKKDSLGDRMKGNYENRSKTFLTRRTPVIIRLDGKAFHTFTRGMKRPYDTILMDTMQHTMLELCKNIQGCKFGYTQSDEITLVITDYDTLTTDAWFGYNVQKMCSVGASMATLYFNTIFAKNADVVESTYTYYKTWNISDEYHNYVDCLNQKRNQAMFDARCFSIPKEEVCNCLIWRQQDATRNAIQMLAQANFSHNELQNKSVNILQDMLMTQKQINFNEERTDFKRGSACYRKDESLFIDKDEKWFIDKEIPVFTQDRNFVERWI